MSELLYTVIIYPLKTVFEVVFVFAQLTFKETGLSVVFVSMAISLLCLPLYQVAERWQRRERDIQKRMKPKIDTIRAVFKGDERYMILSTYYRQNHYHPVYALRSTMGLGIQIPFFIAAYSFLVHNEALKGASFLWLSDLSLPDGLISLGGERGYTYNILPVIMTVINGAAAFLYTKGFPWKEKAQLYGMAVVFLVLLYRAPSGLVLYWTCNNGFSLAKQGYDAIKTVHKKTLLKGLVSLLCAGMVYYVLAIHRGSPQVRYIFSVMLCFLVLMLWTIPLIRKGLSRIPCAEYAARDQVLLFGCSCALVGILSGLYLPSMLVASSPQEFAGLDTRLEGEGSLFFVVTSFFQALGFFVFWPLCFFFLFARKNTFALLGLMVSAGTLCNVFLFPGDYGIITLDMIFDKGVEHGAIEMLSNLAILGILSALLAWFFFRGKGKAFIPITALCGIALLGLSINNMRFIAQEYQKTNAFRIPADQKIENAVEPLFHFSKTGRNTVVIMLDRAGSAFFPFILEELPELAARYSGFVYYPNTLSFNGYTSLGAPPLFGGYEYTPSEINKRHRVSMVQKHNEALLLMPILFSRLGFQVTVTDPPYPNYSQKEDLRLYDEYPDIKAMLSDGVYTDLWLQEHQITLPTVREVLIRNILWYSILKIAPFCVREGIYQRGGWFASFSGYKLTKTLNGYAVLDLLPRLTDTQTEKEYTALIMVNNTTHDPSLMQAPDYRPVLNVTNYGTSPYAKESEYHGNAAALLRLSDWFSFLKQEGVYDNTRIIIVSDHGPQKNYVSPMYSDLPVNIDNFNPLLLVKDFNASGNIKTDHTFMTNADVPFLALQGQIENPVNPFTGAVLTQAPKEQPLYVACSGNIHLEDPDETQASLDPHKDYYVRDNIFDPACWEAVSP